LLLFPENKPRSVVGAVYGMARPARPPEEAQAVREAAEIVRQETGLTAVSAISQEIARRVTANLTIFIEQDADDPMAMALESVRLSLKPCPFHKLATDPEIDVLKLFVSKQVERLICRSGAYLSEMNQGIELRGIANEVRISLSRRYARVLSSS
jgi:hypothetical protein